MEAVARSGGAAAQMASPLAPPAAERLDEQPRERPGEQPGERPEERQEDGADGRPDTPRAPAAAFSPDDSELDFASDTETAPEPEFEPESVAAAGSEPVAAEETTAPATTSLGAAEPAAEAEVPAEDAGDKVRAILRGRGEGAQAAAGGEKEARLRAALMERAPSRWQAWLVPGAAAAALLLLVGILVLARESIVRILPGASTIYSAIGFDGPGVLGAGLEFREVTSRREWAGTDEVLIVRGVIANVAKDTIAVPPVRVALYDIDEYEVQSMTVPHAVQELAAGSTLAFEARIPNPALKAQRIRVTFQAPGRRGSS